ncbi:MAG: sigma 54-interacting transcriptional regulator [Kofleriaceae bacterium]
MNRAQLPSVLVSVAQNRTLAEVLHAIVDGIARCSDVVLTRIWLEGPGDVCGTCRFRSECPDQARCLHLVASAGNPIDPSHDHTRLDGAFKRFPLGVRKIGRTARSGEPLLLPAVSGDEDWIADRAWFVGAGIKTFAAQPLIFRGEVLGVLALFDRGTLTQEDFDWLRVVSDHAAVSIANARAFEEIEILKARLEAENSYLRDEVTSALGVGGLIGQSAGLAKVMQQIQLVAPTDAAVLITGESGTGKEVVARAIHDSSPRKDRPFIKVNCSAVPDTLFESEFFGHAKGAFTGANRDKLGRFELADGGTLLLDEIGEVPLAMQAKLLRVLQEQEVERVGEARVRKLNVRVLAATNRVLRDEVEAGRFRQDLFYRLSVFPIEIPPLRERLEDVGPLAAHFASQAAQRLNRPPPRLSQSAIAELIAHDWPGNVRELQHAVERAMIVSRGGRLRFELAPRAELTRASPPVPHVAGAALTRAELKRKERESIEQALRQSAGKIFGPGGAAELLQMKPTTLASRIKALSIRRSK